MNERSRPAALGGIMLIIRRELANYFQTSAGYVIASFTLLAFGLLFVGRAVGSGARYSTEVLSDFFLNSSGVVLVIGVPIAMRLIAEERKAGTFALLQSASLSEGEIVFAKFCSALSFLGLVLGATVFMPLLIFVHGRVSLGHIAVGYLGLLLLGSAVIAIGTFASALTRSQLLATVVGGTITAVLTLAWVIARLVEGVLGDVLYFVALHNVHFRPFMDGVLNSRDVLYYLSVTAFFLVLARNALEARRWST